MKSMKMKKVLMTIISLVLTMVLIIDGGNGFVLSAKTDDSELLNQIPDEITLYYIQNEYINKISMPSNYSFEYQVDTTGFSETPTFSARMGAFVYVSKDGKITPCQRNIAISINMGYTADLDCTHFTDKYDRLEYCRYEPCDDIVDVYVGGYHKGIRVHVRNYAEVYVDNYIKEKAAEITKGLNSDYEKLETIVKWTADNTDYSVNFSYLHNMILNMRGDCIANSRVIVAMCKSLGINASLRRAYQDDERCGVGHINSYIECKNGTKAGEYVADIWAGEKGRGYAIYNEVGGFSVWEEDSSTIFQYDGFDKEITIPDEINGEKITTIGKYNRFDIESFAPMFYGVFGEKDCNVEKITIPSGITTINEGSLRGASKLMEIEVDSANKNYKSVDGVLFDKNGKMLYVPSARDSIVLNASDITSIDECAFDDVSRLNIYYDGTSASWNKMNITLPENVKVFFGTTRVTGISSPEGEINLVDRNTTKQLNVNVIPANAVNNEIIYESNDIAVARVDEKGVITARNTGSCTITATSSDGGFVAEIKVNVTIPGHKVTIDGGVVVDDSGDSYESAVYNEYETVKIVANQEDIGYYFDHWEVPDGVELKQESTNKSDATFVMGYKNITIKAVYREILPVNVYGVNVPEYVCIGSEIPLSVNTGGNDNPNEYKRNTTWESSNTDVATVDSDGVLHAVGFGYTYITANVETQKGTYTSYPHFVQVTEHHIDEDTKVIVQMTDCLSQPTIIKGICTGCHKEVIEIIPADGEHWFGTEDIEVIKPATCEESGVSLRKCLVCGTICEVETEPLGHDWDEGKITKEPTENEPGEKTYTCKRCGKTKIEEFSLTGGDDPGTGGDDPGTGYDVKPGDGGNKDSSDDKTKTDMDDKKDTNIGKTVSVGTKLTDSKNGGNYIVTSSSDNTTVAYNAPASKNVKSVTIPASFEVDGVKYKVTKINANAFKGCKKLSKVTIGANIESIGTKAFYKCAKLKKILFKTKKLTLKSVGKNAFGKINKKAVARVPKKVKKTYKKILKKRGMKGKKQKVK